MKVRASRDRFSTRAVSSYAWGIASFAALGLFACGDHAGCSASEPKLGEEGSSKIQTRGQGEPPLPGIVQASEALAQELARALKKKGTAYKPRTEHLLADGRPEFTNRLILETSPYLLQHAHNPVNWRAWGEEAFARARAENKPVLLSVGYSTCHWCHVMERESFEDKEIAAYINQNFVAIKVDREERPDIDDIYMRAVRVLSGRGGWPMTVLMTPEKAPFFGGTYIPARDGDRGSREGFLNLLRRTSDEYKRDQSRLVAEAQFVSQKVIAAAAPQRPGGVPGIETLAHAVSVHEQQLDRSWGGFGQAPKFPHPSSLDFLMRYQRVAKKTDAKSADAALFGVKLSLDKMASGGVFDQVGGGFHRYSTDRRWLVPHFEKMLYDNAQLAAVYLDAYQITGDENYATVGRRTLDYVVREMRSKEGAFYSATDADSLTPSGHSEEGYFFAWKPEDLARVLVPDEARAVTAFYAVQQGGNFEDRSIFHVPRSKSEVASELGLTEERLEALLESARGKLYVERIRRPSPGLDDKLLTSWNGLMISALARGAVVLDEPKYLEASTKAAEYLLHQARGEGGVLLRVTRNGVSKQRAFLDDHAFLIGGLLDVFQASGQARYLAEAQSLLKSLNEHFWDTEQGGYFKTGGAHEELLVRDKPSYDGAEPSGNSVMADNLLRLSSITSSHELRKRAEGIFQALSRETANAMGATRLLAALQSYHDVPLQVVLVRPDEEGHEPPESVAMRRLAARAYLPGAVVLSLTNSQAERLVDVTDLLDGKRAKEKTTAYVCERGSCELPARDLAQFKRQLEKHL